MRISFFFYITKSQESDTIVVAPKITGGLVVGNNHPWKFVVHINAQEKVQCGGTIISNTEILTTGDCCSKWSADQMKVIIGDYSTTQWETGQFAVSPVRKFEK